jgi:hypothetical protein
MSDMTPASRTLSHFSILPGLLAEIAEATSLEVALKVAAAVGGIQPNFSDTPLYSSSITLQRPFTNATKSCDYNPAQISKSGLNCFCLRDRSERPSLSRLQQRDFYDEENQIAFGSRNCPYADVQRYEFRRITSARIC